MWYLSENKTDVESYLNEVNKGENYQPPVMNWATIHTHQNGTQFAILKNENYPSEMQEIESLDGWFEELEA